mgnify:CR=1 FL=1
MKTFKIVSKYKPAGDQPMAIKSLVEGIESGASAVLAASIFHYGTYSVAEAKQYLASKDIPVRI